MHARGASAAGEAFWASAIAIGFYAFLTLRTGVLYVGERAIDKRKRPALYWGVMSGFAGAIAVLLAVGFYMSTHYPVNLPSR